MKPARVMWIVVALTLAAFAIRVYRLDYFALRGDESFTVQFSSLPAAELFEGIRSVEPNPPLYYYALRGWMFLAGQGDFAPRFFSLFFGVLLVPLVYVFGRSLLTERVGLMAAAIMTVNPFQIFHSQDVRNYTVWPFFMVLAAWWLWRALRRGQARNWAGYTVTTLLALYTHYFTVFVIVADNLFAASLILWRGWVGTAYAQRRWRLLRIWIAVQLTVVAGLLAWLLIGSTHAVTSISAGTAPDAIEMLRLTYSALLVGQSAPKAQQVWIMLPALLLMGIGIVTMAREKPLSLRWLLLVIVTPLLGVFIASRFRPLYEPRYLNQTAPFLYLLAAKGVTGVWGRPRWRAVATTAGIIWLVLAGYVYGQAQFNPRFAKSPDWRARALYLQENQEPGDVIVMNYPDPSLSYYYRGAAPLLYVPGGYLDDKRRAETEQTLQELLRSYRRIWLLPQPDPSWDPDGTVERRLQRSADRVWHGSIMGERAQLYETPSVFPAHFTAWPITFERGIQLAGYRWPRESARAGEPLEVVFYWQPAQRVPQDYNVFTHVTAADGAVLAQKDNAPVNGTYPTSQWLPGELIVDRYEIQLPPDLPSGEYPLELGLYDWRTGNRLRTSDGSDRVILPAKILIQSP
jgi:mannosyltransferase